MFIIYYWILVVIFCIIFTNDILIDLYASLICYYYWKNISHIKIKFKTFYFILIPKNKINFFCNKIIRFIILYKKNIKFSNYYWKPLITVKSYIGWFFINKKY